LTKPIQQCTPAEGARKRERERQRETDRTRNMTKKITGVASATESEREREGDRERCKDNMCPSQAFTAFFLYLTITGALGPAMRVV